MSSSHRNSVLLELRQDFVITKLASKLRTNIQAALRRFRKICCLIRSVVETIVKIGLFLHSDVFFAVGAAFHVICTTT